MKTSGRFQGRESNKSRAALRVSALLASVLFIAPLAASQGKPQKLTDSILGVRLGANLEEAHKKLQGHGTFGGLDTREGGRKEAWTLKGTKFSSIAYETDDEGRIVWITGFVRPDKNVPFSSLGDLTQAASKSENHAVWNVQTPEAIFRLIAKGSGNRARVIHLLRLDSDER